MSNDGNSSILIIEVIVIIMINVTGKKSHLTRKQNYKQEGKGFVC